MEKIKILKICLFLSFMLLLVTNTNTFAQAQGSATAKVVISNFDPGAGVSVVIGDTIEANIEVDVSDVQVPDNLLGSFDGLLTWDQSILQYENHSSPLANSFMMVDNPTKVDSGQFLFNGANPLGVEGKVTLLKITFTVLRTNFEVTIIELQFSAMAAATTFTDLLPILTVTNGIINRKLTGISGNKVENQTPETFELSNYPNPFNPETIIHYQVPEKSQVSLKIYNLLGYEVRSLVEEEQAPGYYSVKFDGMNLAAGVYLYILEAGNFTKAKKMLLLK